MQVEEVSTKPSAIILFGSPGSGKGTQAKLLGESLAGPHISTGDMLRQHIEAGDDIGIEAQRLIKTGKLVPDEMVNRLVEERLKKPDVRSGMILDGYPRTVNQAKVLLELMKKQGFGVSVVHLVVDYEKIVARLSGRRQCPVCGTLYSLTTNPPKVAGICDREGAKLVTREDDREEVIRQRLHEYDVQTVPILNFFRESGVPLFEVNAGDVAPEQVRQRVCDQLLEAGVISAPAGRNYPVGRI